MARISSYIARITVFSLLLVLMLSPVADAQLKIKFAPKDKGLLFETQVYGIEVPGVPVYFEEGEILFTKDINNNMIKPSIMYRPKGVDIEGVEFGIVVFNYFHEFMMAFPACEAEPVRDGTHGKWVNIRPWGQFVHFSFDYFVYIRKIRFKGGKVTFYENADQYAYDQILKTFDGDAWVLDHERKFLIDDITYFNTEDYGLNFNDYRMRFDR
jgi:hypothetical protein